MKKSRLNAPRFCSLVALASLLWQPVASAAPLLHCLLSYAGATQTLDVAPVTDPYRVRSVDVGGRFLFKAVMVGDAVRVQHIALYAYLDRRPQPLLLQEAKYLPPFASAPLSLTGEQHLYGGPLERELIYNCTLNGVAR